MIKNSNNLENWKIKKAVGTKTEKLYEKYLKSKNIPYRNISNQYKEYGHKGDFIVREKIFVDTKCDYQICQYHNIFLEDQLVRNTGVYDGWWRKAEYDYLMFNSSNENLMIFIDYKKLHKDFEKLPKFYKSKRYNFNEKAYCNGYLIPMKILWKRGIIRQVVSYKGDKFNSITIDHWQKEYIPTKRRKQ